MKRFLCALLTAAMVLSLAIVPAMAEAADPITFSIFVDHSWFWFDKWEDEVAKEITNQTGVSFDVTRATDSTQLAIMIAGGDLPDIVYTATTATIALLADPDVCYSYNELVDQYGVDLNASESEIRNNTRTDGNYYALLNAYTSQETIDEGNTLLSGGTKSISYRTDIWEAIGSPAINTLDDLESALTAAKEQYPDVIPLLNDKDYLWFFAEQLGMNGSSALGYDESGKAVHFLNHEIMPEYLGLLNRYARKGLISAEAQTYSYDKFLEVRNSGKSFMQLRATDEAMSSNNAAIKAGTDYRWQLITHEFSDKAKVSVNTGIGWSGTFITKNNKDPERAIKFMEWARSDEGRRLCSWGIEGTHWEYNDEGKTVTTKAYQDAMNEGKQKQDDFGIAVWIFGDKGDENAFIDHAATNPDWVDYIARLQSAVKNTQVMSELYFCIPTEGDMLTIWTELDDMYKSEVLKVIFAETDDEYNTAVAEMYEKADKIGIARLEEWMNEQLEARKN